MSRVRRRHALVVLILSGFVVVSAALYLLHTGGIRYKAVYLPRSVDPTFRGHSINDRGQVVFSSATGLYVWDPNGGLRDVGVLPVTYYSRRVPINDAGQLCGAVLDPNGCMQAFFWDPNTGLQLLGTFGEECSWALDINSKGQVVGQAGPHNVPQSPPKAFLWQSGAPPVSLDLRSRGFTGPASCVNDQAQVGGFAFSRGQPQGCFAFRWDPAGSLSTHLIGSAMTGVAHIDRRGSLVWARHKEPCVVVWGKEDGEQQIQFSGDAAYVVGVNDAGQILVGVYRSPFARVSWFRSVVSRWLPALKEKENGYWLCDPRRGKIHIQSHARDLSPRFEAVALNNRGWILGRDYDPNDTCRWLILKPIHDN